MRSALTWIVFLAVGVAPLFYAASANMPGVFLGLTALICLVYAAIAIADRQSQLSAGASESALSSCSARYIALVWAWAALGMLVIYTLVLDWHEWWQYVLGAGVIAVVCLFFSAGLGRDAEAGREDETMLKLARYLAIGQLVGMIVAMIGLYFDDKMPRDPREPDWAANTIFFFGAAALAAISAHSLWTTRSK